MNKKLIPIFIVILMIILFLLYNIYNDYNEYKNDYKNEAYSSPASYNLIIIDGNGNMSSVNVTPSYNPTPGTSNALTPSLSSIPSTSNIVTVDSNGNIGLVSPSAVYTSYMGPGQNNVSYNLLSVDSNNNFSTISSNLFNPCQVYGNGTMNGVPLSSGGCKVDCVVSDWSGWSACPCNGGGTITRTRTVTVPPANGGTACPVLSETQNCVNNEPCANDPECSFIRSDADLRSASNIVTNLTLKNACGGGSNCNYATYIKCGKTPGGKYIRTSQYDAYLSKSPGVYFGDPISSAKSTMTLRNGTNIFGPCGNCGPATVGASLDTTSSDPQCKNAGPDQNKFNQPICNDALMAVDSNGATPPPNPKPENTACSSFLFGMCMP